MTFDFRIEQKGMTFDRDFCIHSPFLLPTFLGWKRKGEKKNQGRGQKSCLSARSDFRAFLEPSAVLGLVTKSLNKNKICQKSHQRLQFPHTLVLHNLFVFIYILHQETLKYKA